MRYSAALTEEANQSLISHLVRKDGQEDLCFAFYAPSTGQQRFTGLIKEIISPVEGERNVHGNVSFNPEYFDRVVSLALKRNLGICFMHSHPAKGWQSMSYDDIQVEKLLSPRVKAITGLPLLGMTVGRDGTWSARFWTKTAPRQYERFWCESVRVVGKKLDIHFCDQILPPPYHGEEFGRTISSWGQAKQENIARMTVGVIGVGSVGGIIAQSLLRTGVGRIIFFDFDVMKNKNLDRQLGVLRSDVGRLKVEVYHEDLIEQRIEDHQEISMVPYSIVEEEGLKRVLDCDVVFSCVDRPWPRYILDQVSYANLIPCIDGGIETGINIKGNNIGYGRWKAHAVGPSRRCMKCLGQYEEPDVALEMNGDFDDPTYTQGLPKEHFINRGENVFAFSLSLSGMLVQQFLSLILQPNGIPYGPKEMDFRTGTVDSDFKFGCDESCGKEIILAYGDMVNNTLSFEHPVAVQSRAAAKGPERPKVKRVPIFERVRKWVGSLF